MQSLNEAEDPDALLQHMISLGDCITDLKSWHEATAKMLDTAFTRILIAPSHVAVQQDDGASGDKPPLKAVKE